MHTIVKKKGEYCLSNHRKCADLSNVPTDPEPGKQRHGEVHHGVGFGNEHGPPFEAPTPMTLAAMMALDPGSPGLAHDQSLGGDHRGLHRPMLGAGEPHRPLGQALHQLLQGGRLTTPTLPGTEAAWITLKSLPDPEVAPCFSRQGHSASLSRTSAFPLGAGLAACSAASRRIHVKIVLAHTPNIFPKAFIETP
jgi:hypothetical protein